MINSPIEDDVFKSIVWKFPGALKTLDQMLNVADVILQNQYSVRKVEELVNLILNDEEKLETLEEKLEAISKRPNVSKNNNETNFLIEEISKAFHQKFEIPIKIKHSKKGGLISIKYKTETELAKIMQNFVESKSWNHKIHSWKQEIFTLH